MLTGPLDELSCIMADVTAQSIRITAVMLRSKLQEIVSVQSIKKAVGPASDASELIKQHLQLPVSQFKKSN